MAGKSALDLFINSKGKSAFGDGLDREADIRQRLVYAIQHSLGYKQASAIIEAHNALARAEEAEPGGKWVRHPEGLAMQYHVVEATVTHLMKEYVSWVPLTLDMPLFVLRHKATGVIMAELPGRAGGTYIDPFRVKKGTKPRLFGSKKAAADALRWWAEGEVVRGYDGGDFGEAPVTYVDGVKPVPGRDATEWEVVPVKVIPDA